MSVAGFCRLPRAPTRRLRPSRTIGARGVDGMSVEWQGDHKLLDATGDKQNFERELTRPSLDPSKFIVEVRREPNATGRHYSVYVTDLQHLDRDTLKLEGGHGENWIAEFARTRR